MSSYDGFMSIHYRFHNMEYEIYLEYGIESVSILAASF